MTFVIIFIVLLIVFVIVKSDKFTKHKTEGLTKTSETSSEKKATDKHKTDITGKTVSKPVVAETGERETQIHTTAKDIIPSVQNRKKASYVNSIVGV